MFFIMWRGAGILVLILPIITILLVDTLVVQNNLWLSIGIGGIIAGILLYLLGKKINVTIEITPDCDFFQVLQAKQLNKRHTLYEWPIEKWGIVVFILGTIVIIDWLIGVAFGFSIVLLVLGFIMYLLDYVLAIFQYLQSLLPF